MLNAENQKAETHIIKKSRKHSLPFPPVRAPCLETRNSNYIPVIKTHAAARKESQRQQHLIPERQPGVTLTHLQVIYSDTGALKAGMLLVYFVCV